MFDKANDGIVTIFNASRNDPLFETKTKFDVVTDGNMQVNRKLENDEKKYAKKNLPGRPKTKKQEKASHGKKPTSRCKAVSKTERVKLARTQTGGLFVTMNMKNRCSGTGVKRNADKAGRNEILHLAEMLNGENTAYKRLCLQDMKKSKMHVGKYAHDCSCVVATHFEGGLCDKCYLDGHHSKKHKCNTPAIIYKKTLNSQAAEQLWSRLDKLSWISKMTRPHYRCFLHHYCLWRNAFTLGACRQDTNPCLSKRKMLKRTVSMKFVCDRTVMRSMKAMK